MCRQASLLPAFLYTTCVDKAYNDLQAAFIKIVLLIILFRLRFFDYCTRVLDLNLFQYFKPYPSHLLHYVRKYTLQLQITNNYPVNSCKVFYDFNLFKSVFSIIDFTACDCPSPISNIKYPPLFNTL